MTALMLIDYVRRYRRRNENTRARTEQHIDTRAIDIRGDVKITVPVEIAHGERVQSVDERHEKADRFGPNRVAGQERAIAVP